MLSLLLLITCSTPDSVPLRQAVPSDLERHCAEIIGEPRIEEPVPGVLVAVGWDLANTTLIQTDAGNVIIDAGMSPTRAAPIREALLARSPGRIAAVIYTHSHIDHVGGASVWVEEGTQVWATERFTAHFFKQYDQFLKAERIRGARQFGQDVPDSALPCSALGRRVDLEAALALGARLPDHTFSGETELVIGGVTLRLVEAHGETDDQLFVWLPDQRVLFPGDNWYRAFPNLYTIRGSRPRPVDAWIESLDAMRRLAPEILVPSHTGPLVGTEAVARELQVYRDGIQWVRDAVVRGANAGLSLDQVVAEATLPPHLASEPSLQELYGQVDWSARALYTNALGWFDGQAHQLQSLDTRERAELYVGSMGGHTAVLTQARAAEPRVAAELLALLEGHPETALGSLDADFARVYRALAAETPNSNRRGYLLQSAAERSDQTTPMLSPDPDAIFVGSVPLEMLFKGLASRLVPVKAMDIHESVAFDLGEEGRWTVTQRYGVAEVVLGASLPGTPPPVATVTTDGETWRQISLKTLTPLQAIRDGRLKVDGALAFSQFISRFDRSLLAQPIAMP